ncbi:MAG: rhamnulokinase family protein [Candidatus Dormibacteria bacterium]
MTTKAGGHLAIDLGAESGRAFVGSFSSEVQVAEIGRFRNVPLVLPDRTCWNITGILQFILDSISAAGQVDSLSIDSWGVDFGLLRADGSLVALPRCYRDQLNQGMAERMLARVSPLEVYRQTGIQMMEINTICQLLALAQKRPDELAQAETLLLVPDLLRYWLGGDPVVERTNASTTQMLRPDGTWAAEMVQLAGIDPGLLPAVAESTAITGHTRGGIPLIAGASHDTASAVAGAPLTDGSVFISCGTWSLVGSELAVPVISDRALALNLSNEQGVNGTTRLLRNVMGLWLLQECRREWEAQDGRATDYPDLTRMAEASTDEPSLIDPDDPAFLRPTSMEGAIRAYCDDTEQGSPANRGEIVRCILTSLALRYRWVIEALQVAGAPAAERINIVGGGSLNSFLCQATADATGRTVEAGPAEATVLGNLLVQAVATRQVSSILDGREVIRRSFAIVTYRPRGGGQWEKKYERFCALGPATTSPQSRS